MQSRFLAVGALAAWADPEVGAIATQAWINVSYGRDGLDLLRGSLGARRTVERLVEADERRDLRQLGIVDASGSTYSYTGSGCLDWAGHRTGDCYAAQGNTLVSSATVDALAETFEATRGQPLAERLLAALAEGQAAGGDRRGQQSAALYVTARGGGYGGGDVVVDLRVDDDPGPIVELLRLYELHRLYFGATPDEEWVDVDDDLRAELCSRLDALGYAGDDFAADLDAWAGHENLEERVDGADRIDPVVLAALRKC